MHSHSWSANPTINLVNPTKNNRDPLGAFFNACTPSLSLNDDPAGVSIASSKNCDQKVTGFFLSRAP